MKENEYVVTVLIARHVKVKALNDIQAEIEVWKKLSPKLRGECVALRAFHKEEFTFVPDAQFLRENVKDLCSPDREWLNSHLTND